MQLQYARSLAPLLVSLLVCVISTQHIRDRFDRSAVVSTISWQQDPDIPSLDWLGSDPELVIRDAFREVGMAEDDVRWQAEWATIAMGLRKTGLFRLHPVYGKEPAERFLVDAFSAIGCDRDTAIALAGVAGTRLNIRPDLDQQQRRQFEQRVAGIELAQMLIDGAHADAFLSTLQRSFTAVGYLDREADAFIDTLRDRWNLRGGEARRPNEPVLDWRRSNLHLLLTDAFVLAAGHTRADARQLAYNAMLQLNMGIDRETFDRKGESVEAHPATAVFKHDPRGMTSRRMYVTYTNAAVPSDLTFHLVIGDLAADIALDERTAQPVLKSVLDLPNRTTIRVTTN